MKNRVNKLMITTGVVVAMLIVSMAANPGVAFNAKGAVEQPVPFGSTMYELILTRPVGALFGGE